MLSPFLISVITVFVFMNIMYLFSRKLKDNSIVDIGWGIGFFLIALVNLIYFEIKAFDYLILTAVVFIWGTRLAFYIYCRNKGKGEDFRYKEWREDWGNKEPIIAYFKVFMLQGIIMLFVAYPIWYLASNYTAEFDIFDLAGLLIFLFGFLFESIGDYQMYKFKSVPENKGKLITTGLWKLTRHPNYFGEMMLWWGIALIAFEGEYNWTVFLGPFIINFFLIKISGVPMLEKKYEGREDWKEYAEKTPALFPKFWGTK